MGKAVDQLDCPGLSYADDVKPWLGARFGVALMPGRLQGNPPVAFAIQVSDEAAARKGIAALTSCDESPAGSSFGVAFDNGFMLVAPTQAQATSYATSADQHALADSATFKADMDALGDAGIATMWVDVKAAANAYGDQIGQLFQTEFASTRTSLRSAPPTTVPDTRIAATFRFGSDHVELATVFTGAIADFGNEPNPIVDLPDSTVFAISASGVGPTVTKSWNNFVQGASTTDPAIQQELQQFEDQTGIALPGDLTTIFGRNLMLSVGDRGLGLPQLGADDLSKLDFGLRLTNDPAKLDALYDKVQSLIQSATGSNIPLSKVDFADGIAVASNDAYARALADLNGGLGDSGDFQSVITDGADQAFVGYFDFAAVRAQILKSMADDGESQETIDNVRPVRAFGFTAGRVGDYGHLTIRMSVDD